MYGRLPKTALNVQLIPDDIEPTDHKHEYLVKLRRQMKFMHQVTNYYLTTNRDKMKQIFDKKGQKSVFSTRRLRLEINTQTNIVYAKKTVAYVVRPVYH